MCTQGAAAERRAERSRAPTRDDHHAAAQSSVSAANPKQRAPERWTLLHRACASGHVDIAKLLLSAQPPARVNAVKDNGRTPLHLACTFGYDECVRELIAARADVHMTDREGRTAKQGAQFEGHTEVIVTMQRLLLNPFRSPYTCMQLIN